MEIDHSEASNNQMVSSTWPAAIDQETGETSSNPSLQSQPLQQLETSTVIPTTTSPTATETIIAGETQRRARRLTKESLRFNPIWKKRYPWVVHETAESKERIFCSWCRAANCNNKFATDGCEWIKEDSLVRHQKVKEHVNIVKGRTIIPDNLLPVRFTQYYDVGKAKVIENMRIAYFMIKQNMPLNGYQDFCNFVTFQFQNQTGITLEAPPTSLSPLILKQNANRSSSASVSGSSTNAVVGIPTATTPFQISINEAAYVNPVSITEIIKAMSRLTEDAVLTELSESSCWSLILDHTTFKNGAKSIAVYSKHLSSDYSPGIRFLGTLRVPITDPSTASNLVQVFCTSKRVPLSKLVHIGSDGVIANLDKLNEVESHIKAKQPFLISIHSLGQSLHLAMKDAADQIPYFAEYQLIMNETLDYLASVPDAPLNLKSIFDYNFGNPESRFLSWCQAISVNIQLLDEIRVALSLSQTKSANMLYEKIGQDFTLASKLLNDVYLILEDLGLFFKGDPISIANLQPLVTQTVLKLRTAFIGTKETRATYGTLLRHFMEQLNLNSSETLPRFIAEYASATITAIQNRFPGLEIYHAMRIFDPYFLPNERRAMNLYGKEEIEMLNRIFGNPILQNGIRFPSIVDSQALTKEWAQAKYLLAGYRELAFADAWKKTFETSDFRQEFPNVTKVVSIALTVPFSTTTVENLLMQQKRVISQHFGTMDPELLQSYMMITLNGPGYDKFDYEKAYDLWARSGFRVN
ncbi:hypothetical protein G9A89_002325 [Geosiphon pyriformis]|nr:hypothetical protein G9A89_002325 [Geosiphon pyriformis]